VSGDDWLLPASRMQGGGGLPQGDAARRIATGWADPGSWGDPEANPLAHDSEAGTSRPR